MINYKEGIVAKIIYAIPRFYDWFTQFVTLWNWEKWQGRVFEDLTGNKILEIGVGPGRLYINLLKRGFNVTGIEMRKGMADVAKERIEAAGFKPDIHLSSVYSLPFSDKTFDGIVMTFVLGEVRDLDRAVKEMKRVLKNGGKVVSINIGYPRDKNFIAKTILNIINSSEDFHLDRGNKPFFEKNGFIYKREDFGPFNILHKFVAVNK